MALLSNHTSRMYTLPRRERDGVSFGGVGFAVRPGEPIEAPVWYVAELHLEPGFAARFRSGEMTVSHVEPVMVTVAEEAPLPAPRPAPVAPKGKSKKKG